MTLMVVFLLALNAVLAVGFFILWLQLHARPEKFEEFKEHVLTEIHDVEARMTNLEKNSQTQSPDSEWPKNWFHNPLPTTGRNQMPERYRLAINMADNGMDLSHLSQALGVSKYEADQLAHLARLGQLSNQQDVQDLTPSKDSDPV